MSPLKRSLVGLAALGLVALGAGGYWGWPAACLVLGLPIAGFYLWSEARRISEGGD